MVGIREDQPLHLDPTLAAGGLLPPPSHDAPDPIDALGDLVDPKWKPGGKVRLSDEFEAFRGMLGVKVVICRPGDPEPRG